MGLNIFQYAVANLFLNLFVGTILIIAGDVSLMATANPYANTADFETTQNAGWVRVQDVWGQKSSATSSYKTCTDETSCVKPSSLQDSSSYEPILTAYNFFAMIAKAIKFVALVFVSYMTAGFWTIMVQGGSPPVRMLFGLLFLAWNLTTWYLFFKFVVKRERV